MPLQKESKKFKTAIKLKMKFLLAFSGGNS